MRKCTALTILTCSLVVFYCLSTVLVIAQKAAQPAAESLASPFELKNGDRVVFLGNSLFENDFQYGYLELALTTRWPDRDVTFRNLGWSGDNVFGVARSTITNPPTAYELLMEHLTKTQPTVVFIGYGGIEAQDGEAGLPAFKEGLTKLLDKVDQLGATAILLSPIPILDASDAASQTRRNAMLEVYASTIAKTAADRGKRYIDIYKPILDISRKEPLTDNGIHLNETGYYYLAGVLETALGLRSQTAPVAITVSKTSAQAIGPAKILTAGPTIDSLKFTVDERYLPLPFPRNESGRVPPGQLIKITGLKKGFYTLTADKSDVVTASARQWEEGVEIRQGPTVEQVRELQQMILKKNELFFFQYRPMNTTYILGMRAHEQGRHAKGLEEQSLIIKWLESQIALTRAPRSRVYQLTPLK